jgi:hypothetical protein
MTCTATTYPRRFLCSLLWLNPLSDSLRSGLFLVLPTTCLENHPQVGDQGAIAPLLPQAMTISLCGPYRLTDPQHQPVQCHLRLVLLGPLDPLHPLHLMRTQDGKLLAPFGPLLCLIRRLVRVRRPSLSLRLLLLWVLHLRGGCRRTLS